LGEISSLSYAFSKIFSKNDEKFFKVKPALTLISSLFITEKDGFNRPLMISFLIFLLLIV